MNYEPLIDRLMQHYTSGRYLPEVQAAKEQFFEKAGTFDEMSLDFESKMAQFVDWYLFSRRMNLTGEVAAEMALDDPGFAMTPEDRVAYLNLRNSRHSLFEYQRLKGSDVHIRDLFTGFKYTIHNSRVTQGFNKEEFFEARLVPAPDGFVFASSFCFHPAVVAKFIQQEIKRISGLPDEEQGRAREELIARLFKMKHKHEQYRHLDVQQIYSNDSKLRI
jgi:hypothetical protein